MAKHLLKFVAIIGLLLANPVKADAYYELFTDLGTVYLKAAPKKSPATVSNFDKYVADGFYSHLLFHRVVDGFVVQTGGYNTKMEAVEPDGSVVNESNNGLSNVRGSVAMARYSDPDSATSQFYINLRDNTHLDWREDKSGYTVFAHVVCGLDVMDAIGRDPVIKWQQFTHLPSNPIRLIWIKKIASNNDGLIKCQRQ